MDLEQWVPSWFGNSLDRTARGKAIETRKKCLVSHAALINSLGSFWLSHFAVGQIEIPAILEHLLVVSQIAEEHTTQLAAAYDVERDGMAEDLGKAPIWRVLCTIHYKRFLLAGALKLVVSPSLYHAIAHSSRA